MNAEKKGAFMHKSEKKAVQNIATDSLRFHSIELRQKDVLREAEEKDIEIKTSADQLNKATSELQDIKERVIRLHGKISEQEYYENIVKDLEKELNERSTERNQLQARVSELAKSPFSKEAEDLSDVHRKIAQAENRLIILKDEEGPLKDRKRKAIYDNEKLKREVHELRLELQSIRMEIDNYNAGMSNDYLSQILAAQDPSEYRELMRLLGFEGGIPPWARTSIMLPKESNQDIQILLSEIERLKLEKAELTAELEKMQLYLKETGRVEETKRKVESRLETIERKYETSPLKERDALRKELADTKTSLILPNQPEAEVDNGSDFSVLSHMPELEPNVNILKLLIIEAVYNEGKLPLTDPSAQPTTAIDVAFYNHDLKWSGEEEGYKARYIFEIDFEVVIDESFLSYLYHNDIKIVCYSRQESELKPIGKASIKLRKFFDFMLGGNRSGVFGERVQIENTLESNTRDMRIGHLRYKLKMLSNIENELVQYRSKMEDQLSSGLAHSEKTFKITIVGCSGLRSSSDEKSLSTFVHYEFFKEICRTKTAIGSNPSFDDEKTFKILMNPEFVEYLNTKEISFVVMDNYSTTKGPDEDILPTELAIGKASVKLTPLISGDKIDDKFTLYSEKNNDIVGYISVIIQSE